MKKIIILLLLISVNLYSQEFLDEMAQKTCDCIQDIDLEEADASQIEIKLGMCIIKVIPDYKEDLKETFGLDLSTLNSPDMEETGRIVGERMVSICPDVFLAMSFKLNDEPSSEFESLTESTSASVTGKIIKVSGEPFVTVYVKDNQNRMVKLLWLGYFENSEDYIASEEEMKGLSVEIEYYSMNLYDSRIKDYVPYNIISTLKVTEE